MLWAQREAVAGVPAARQARPWHLGERRDGPLVAVLDDRATLGAGPSVDDDEGGGHVRSPDAVSGSYVSAPGSAGSRPCASRMAVAAAVTSTGSGAAVGVVRSST